MQTKAMKATNKATIGTLGTQDIYVGYDKTPVVKGVSFTAKAGEITALIGANGCGKSTLLKSIARILKPSQGQVIIDGQSVHTMPSKELAKRMALLPQGPIAPEGLTVYELVSYGRFPHQSLLQQWSAEDSLAVEKAMQATDTTEFANLSVSSLSGGQRQRVWIAMALAQDTDIIVLDEPTTFLDLKVQIDVMTLLRRIAHEQNRILLVVLHELNIAASFADTVIMMKNGQLIAAGSPTTTITPESLKAVFGLDAQIIPDPQTHKPVCIPLIPT